MAAAERQRRRSSLTRALEVAGLDALETPRLRGAVDRPRAPGRPPGRSWRRWPSRSALWQLVVWSGWKPELRAARPVRRSSRGSAADLGQPETWEAVVDDAPPRRSGASRSRSSSASLDRDRWWRGSRSCGRRSAR